MNLQFSRVPMVAFAVVLGLACFTVGCDTVTDAPAPTTAGAPAQTRIEFAAPVGVAEAVGLVAERADGAVQYHAVSTAGDESRTSYVTVPASASPAMVDRAFQDGFDAVDAQLAESDAGYDAVTVHDGTVRTGTAPGNVRRSADEVTVRSPRVAQRSAPQIVSVVAAVTDEDGAAIERDRTVRVVEPVAARTAPDRVAESASAARGFSFASWARTVFGDWITSDPSGATLDLARSRWLPHKGIVYTGQLSMPSSPTLDGKRMVYNKWHWDNPQIPSRGVYEHEFFLNNSAASMYPGTYISLDHSIDMIPDVTFFETNLPYGYLDTRLGDSWYDGPAAFTTGTTYPDRLVGGQEYYSIIVAPRGSSNIDNASFAVSLGHSSPSWSNSLWTTYSDDILGLYGEGELPYTLSVPKGYRWTISGG